MRGATHTLDKYTEGRGAKMQEELYGVIPGGILRTDGTLTDRACRADPGAEGSMYSNRVAVHAHNTNVASNKRGEIVWQSKPHPGSRHDMHVMRILVKEISRLKS